MFEPKFKNRGLVRAVYVVGTNDCGCICSTTREDAEDHGNIWAVGVWRRDDDPDLQNKLDHDFEMLNICYRRLCGNEFVGGAYTYEYKDYRK